MASPPGSDSNSPVWQRLGQALPWLVLAVCLLITMQLWKETRRDARHDLQAIFDARVREVTRDLQQRMNVYEQVLRSAQGLFSASRNVERDEFRIYVEQQQLELNYPGIRGLGYALIVPHAQKARHIAAMRESMGAGLPAYDIKPEGRRPSYAPVVFLEPSSRFNRQSLGLDMYTNPADPHEGDLHRAAMERARDSGKAAISGKVQLAAQDGRGTQPGFMMYLPVYKISSSHNTVTERRAGIIGWVYAPFLAEELMKNLLGEHAEQLDFEIIDGKVMSEQSLMHDSDDDYGSRHHAGYQNIQQLEIAGHPWTVAIRSHPGFEALEAHHRTYLVAFFGIAISLLLALLTRLLVQGRERAVLAARKMNKDLVRSEASLHAMLDNLPHLTWLKDTKGRFVAANQSFLKTTGKQSLDQVLGCTDLDLWPCELAEKNRADDAEVMRTRRQKSVTERSIMEDGRIAWVDTFKAPIIGKNGKLLGTAGIAKDITERKLTEDALATREREFRTLAENLPDNIVRYDLQARKTYVNSAVVRMLGTDSSLLIGKDPEESSLERIEEISEYKKVLRKVLESGDPDEFEMTVPHASDGVQIHNVRFVAERDAQGKITGALAIGRDITAQKAAEAALREREQRYHEIFDNAVEGMYLLEVTEEGRFRNLDINPALAASTGMPRETMIGKFVDDTVPEDIGRLIVEKYRRCVAAGKTIQESIELDLPSGKHYYYSTITPIYYDGRIRRLIGISRDITELKRVEHELEKSREQLRGLTARREKVREDERKYIAREVHDELGQILTGLQMDVSMLAYRFGNNIPALHEHLQGTLALVNKSLTVARNVAASLRPGSLDMGIVSAIEWLVERYSKNTGIKCEVHVCDEDRNIELNESASIALFRIAQESLTNVARHAQASKIDIAISQEGDEYLLEIRDNGRGFDAADTKAGSFGLLGIRERVYMLSGEMAIVSTPGHGTAISVRIPAKNNSTENNLSPEAA